MPTHTAYHKPTKPSQQLLHQTKPNIMTRLYFLIIPFIYSLGFTACSNHQSSNKDEPLQIEIAEPYSNQDLIVSIFQTDSLLDQNNAIKGESKKSHPLLNLLRPNIVPDKSGMFLVSVSTIIGYAGAKDTAAVENHLKQSPVMPKDAIYEWLLHDPAQEYALVAHKTNETRVILSNPEVEYIRSEQGDNSTVSGLKGLFKTSTGSNTIIRIKLNPSGIRKITGRISSDALLLKIDIGNRTFKFSQPTDQIQDGILITQAVNQSFIDSIEKMYPILSSKEK
jgi:hypothetical protein